MKKNRLRSILSQASSRFALVFCLVGPINALADEASDISRLLRNGQLDQALARADAYLTSKPRDPQIRFLKGLVLTEQGKNADAIKIFNRLTEDYPDLPEPYNNLAVLYASQGQYEKARQSLEMAIRTHPSYATAYENLGDVYSKLASQSYDKALQLDSGNATAEIKLSMVKDLISGNRSKPTPPTPPIPSTQTNPAPAIQAPAVAATTPPMQIAVTTPATQSPNSTVTLASPNQNINNTAPSSNYIASNTAHTSSTTNALNTANTSNASVLPTAPKTNTSTNTTATNSKALPNPATTANANHINSAPTATAPIGLATRGSDTEILNVLGNWAEAWSNQDVNQYLMFYSDKFNPSSGQSRNAWEAERRKRINNKGRIEVRVESPIIVYEGDQAIVQFKQVYISDRLKNTGVKTLVFSKSGNKWLIIKEQASN